MTGIGTVSVKIPKVRSKDGEPISFHSALVPPYVRKSRSLESSLPWLYLKGISTGEMSEALKSWSVRMQLDYRPVPFPGSNRFGERNINNGSRDDWIKTVGCISGLMVFIQA